MSCNGCRVLRKGCNEKCILRQSLQGIQSAQAQSNATVFVAKFFGRAGLMSFLSGVPDPQRPALFQSLLFEACGRTVNPVSGAVGLLWTGNWHICQSAVETVLRGGVLHAIPELSADSPALNSSHVPTNANMNFFTSSTPRGAIDLNFSHEAVINGQDLGADLDLCLNQQQQSFTGRMTAGGRVNRRAEKRRAETPSLNSDESETMTFESGSPTLAYNFNDDNKNNDNYCNNRKRASGDAKLLRLFF